MDLILCGAVCTNILHLPARVLVTSEDALPLSIVVEELSGARKRPMIISMPITVIGKNFHPFKVPGICNIVTPSSAEFVSFSKS